MYLILAIYIAVGFLVVGINHKSIIANANSYAKKHNEYRRLTAAIVLVIAVLCWLPIFFSYHKNNER
jgi:hypothetical protein